MEYLSQKKGFLGLDAVEKENHKVVVVPFGLEKTVSYGGGTKNLDYSIGVHSWEKFFKYHFYN